MNLNHILFLRALLAHVDQLQKLLGEQWPELQASLNGLLHDLIGEQDEKFLSARVHRIFRLFDGTLADDLVRALLKQSGEQEKQMERSTGTMKITGPTIPETRTVDLHEDASSEEDLIAVARELRRAVAPREPDEEASVVGGPVGITPESAAPSTDHGQPSPVTSQQEDPPRSAYGLLKCPERVRSLSRFTVTIGLSETQVEGVIGNKLRRPDSSVGSYTLTVRLIADGFRLDDIETREVKLWVTADDPYPQQDRHLTALKDEWLNDDRVLMAQYYVNGQMIGAAARYIKVTAEAAETVDISAETTGAGCDMAVPTHKNAPDMTLTISSGNTALGDRLLWSMSTIHPEIDERVSDDEDLTIDLGDSPCEWAKGLMNEINKREGRIDLPGFLRGKGKEIAAKIPWWIRNRLVALSNHITDRAPTLLIVSTEPHVPWELAYMGVGDHGKSDNFLAMEFVIGRWVLGICDENTVKPKPPLPPPQTVTVNDMFVISGDYSETKGWKRLEAAEKEAEYLQVRYHAKPVNATLEELVPWLESGVDAELIHFSIHGKYDSAGFKDGLAMVDVEGVEMLDPSVVRGMTLKRKPFVFLNACQVGMGNTILGDYGGMAEAFLSAEASGVIAPLWSVDDKTAKGIAERFYKGLEDGESPGELLLQERRRFKEKSKSGTFMAYLLFGHPRMQIIGVKSQAGD